VPPALIEHGISLQDDEARDAMGWVNWLQSQGAQQQGAPMAPPQQAAPNGVPVEANLTPQAEPPSNGAGTGAGALRAMFAELGPTPGGESETERLARVKELAQQPDGTRPDGVNGLEALEAQLASSGFQQMEVGQGMLASIAAGEAAARALGVDLNAAPANPADGGDYSERLEQARVLREGGRLDEAFSTYRVLLKMSPDLLPEVAAEIDEALRVAPDHPEARRLLGDVKLKQGDYMGALEAYNRAVELARG
jgi:tetratricopeptide (TPR) repeat protein